MSDATPKPPTHEIVVDQVFPHAPEAIWKALTTGERIARSIRMVPTRSAPVEGTHCTFRTMPAGGWEGVINCQVLEVIPNERFACAWKGGDEGNA